MMMIEAGQRIPDFSIKHMTAGGMEEATAADLFDGKTTVLFGLPAAFSPTCSDKHVPGYVEKAEELKAAGVDQVVCLSVNDPWTMRAWASSLGVKDEVFMLPDGNCDLTKAMGLELDLSAINAGVRCLRFALVAKDREVQFINLDAKPGEFGNSSAETILSKL
jgi:glutaredoxin/glutathione-dependent peroxiredoxin